MSCILPSLVSSSFSLTLPIVSDILRTRKREGGTDTQIITHSSQNQKVAYQRYLLVKKGKERLGEIQVAKVVYY